MSTSRFQLVGSLLRPKELLEYKHKIEHRDDITYPFYNDFPGYKEVESKAIKEVIKKQIDENIEYITDGEFSKSLWHLDFVWGLSGIERFIADEGYTFKDLDGGAFETRKDIGIRIVSELSGKSHHAIDIYKDVLKQANGHTTKITAWAAGHAFTEFTQFNKQYGEDQVYKTKDELRVGLVNAYKEFLDDYKAAGGEVIQFDDCLWELFDETNEDSFFANKALLLSDVADEFVSVNNEVIDYGHSIGLRVWTHNCRGNYASRHASGGTYEAIAKKFLGEQKYDRFFLEWDDDRAGDIIALEAFKNRDDVEVVLGVLSSKTSTLDDEDRAIQLLEKASTYIPKERLYLSHQCGFASCDCGNELSVEEQWNKIRQGQQIAKKFWD